MKLHAVLLSLAAVSVQAAPTLESLKTSALEMPAIPRLGFAAHVPNFPPDQGGETKGGEPFYLNPNLSPILKDKALGSELARIALASQLDRHRALLRLKFGERDWDVSIAGDAGFSRYYLTLRDGADLRLAPLGDLNRLRNEGVDISVAPGVVYNFKLSVNLFSPVRGSTMQIRPAQGTRGPSHAIKTGVLLDAVKDRAAVFTADGKEYWALYGSDVDPATGGWAATRSFLFVHMDGLSSKAWPMAEAALTPNQPYRAELKSTVALTRTADALIVAKPR